MPSQLDQLDHQILSLLSENGRLSCAEIARAVGNISERAIRYRLDRLLEQNVVRVRGLVDPRALGYSITAELMVETEPGQLLDTAQAIAANENVTYVACLAGGSHIRVLLVAQDNASLFRLVNDTLGNIPGVKRIVSSIVPEVVKDQDEWVLPTPPEPFDKLKQPLV